MKERSARRLIRSPLGSISAHRDLRPSRSPLADAREPGAAAGKGTRAASAAVPASHGPVQFFLRASERGPGWVTDQQFIASTIGAATRCEFAFEKRAPRDDLDSNARTQRKGLRTMANARLERAAEAARLELREFFGADYRIARDETPAHQAARRGVLKSIRCVPKADAGEPRWCGVLHVNIWRGYTFATGYALFDPNVGTPSAPRGGGTTPSHKPALPVDGVKAEECPRRAIYRTAEIALRGMTGWTMPPSGVEKLASGCCDLLDCRYRAPTAAR